jgi:hypothetical protein
MRRYFSVPRKTKVNAPSIRSVNEPAGNVTRLCVMASRQYILPVDFQIFLPAIPTSKPTGNSGPPSHEDKLPSDDFQKKNSWRSATSNFSSHRARCLRTQQEVSPSENDQSPIPQLRQPEVEKTWIGLPSRNRKYRDSRANCAKRNACFSTHFNRVSLQFRTVVSHVLKFPPKWYTQNVPRPESPKFRGNLVIIGYRGVLIFCCPLVAN